MEAVVKYFTNSWIFLTYVKKMKRIINFLQKKSYIAIDY